MTSFDKKIRSAGWNRTPYRDRREKINQFITEDGTHHPKRRSPWKCKKNRGNHTLVQIKPTGAPNSRTDDKIQYWANLFSKEYQDTHPSKWNKPYNVFVCTACSKMLMYALQTKTPTVKNDS